MAERTCATCGSETNPHYYYTLKNGTKRPFKHCIQCHNLNHKSNYVKKGAGWSGLPQEQRDRIIEGLKANNKIIDIARKENVSYDCLRKWIKFHKDIILIHKEEGGVAPLL